ncbi:Naphthalene 1,2-dioxygenase system ferredoxin subunit [Roseimaritima multifibrata]|uniref:Naphthalene 1,2-dioxygenase system ferredoxin subunit n=1 Tax=Roseimaritima multifibrata TaxID=1930274 RepID=A0A517MDD6_9BACT|nr:Rieske (2Fe-2S) protein [Roseimaritima multifibrata]QDS92895.1 Naphthalene 1,2-dioxygenase system ferredoxin subunit [Roseimaritima multifibrata]
MTAPTQTPVWRRACEGHELLDSAAIEVVVEGAVLAIFREQQTLYALDAMCAHQGGPIAKGAVHNGCVTCPWHGWQYELATGKQTIHNQKLLETYPVKEEAGAIWVQI